MKRKHLMKHLAKHNCHPIAEGGSHTKVQNFSNSKQSVVPRHSEINEITAMMICKQLEIPRA